MTIELKSVGRPQWIPSKEDLEKIESLAAKGLSQEQIANCVGLHPSTLCEKKNQFPELDEAIKKGKASGIAKVAEALLRNIDLGNVTAQIFYLKTQAGWKDNVPVEADQSFLEKIREQLSR